MNDLDDPMHDHFRALAQQCGEPTAPPNGLLDAVRRRRRRSQIVAAAGVATAVAAIAIAIPALTAPSPGHAPRPGSSQPPSPSPTIGGKAALRHLPTGPVTQPISIDGGQLRIAPPAAGYQPAIPASQARHTAARAARTAGAWGATAGPAYGEVSIAGSLTHGLPVYQSRPAWITVLTPLPDVGCPTVGGAGRTATAVGVILTDADSDGAAVIYTSRGVGICQYVIRRPSVAAARQILGIPWTLLGQRPDPSNPGHVDWHIAFRVPPGAQLVDSPGIAYNAAGRPVLHVTIELPIDRPATCTAGPRRTTWFGPESQPAATVKHAPTDNTADALP